MTKWMTDIIQGVDVGATFKARSDISLFSEQVGLRRLPIFRYDSAFEESNAIHSRIDGITAGVKRGDVVYYQFPTYNGIRFENFFVEHMKVRGINIVALVHDIEFLRFPSHTTFDEIKYLNQFSVVIVHNQHMSDILRKNGLTASMVNLDMFDYTVDKQVLKREAIEKQIILAGSLDKASYLKNWTYNIPIIAYGRQPEFTVSTQVDYRGELQPDVVAENLPSGFGLAWDTNTGIYENSENYAKYNSPHKVSLYLASGLPVIVKKGTAVASIVNAYHLGITVELFESIPDVIDNLTKQELSYMLEQVNQFRKLLTSGYFTKRAIINAEFQLVMGHKEKDIL